MLIYRAECLEKGMYVYTVRYIYNKKICSPFQTNTIWKLKKTMTIEDNKKIRKKLWNEPPNTDVFHCMYEQRDAKSIIDGIERNSRTGKYEIYKTWIPKGTWIVHGKIADKFIGGGLPCIGSRRLMLSKKVHEHNIRSRVVFDFYNGTSVDTGYKTGSGFRSSTTLVPSGYVYNTGSTT